MNKIKKILIHDCGIGYTIEQFGIDENSFEIFMRVYVGDTWGAWFSADLPSSKTFENAENKLKYLFENLKEVTFWNKH